MAKTDLTRNPDGNPLEQCTQREREFVEALLLEAEETGRYNATGAARRAWPHAKARNRQNGWDMSHRPRVRAAIQYLVGGKFAMLTPMAIQRLCDLAEGGDPKTSLRAVGMILQFSGFSRAGTRDTLDVNVHDRRSNADVMASLRATVAELKTLGLSGEVAAAEEAIARLEAKPHIIEAEFTDVQEAEMVDAWLSAADGPADTDEEPTEDVV